MTDLGPLEFNICCGSDSYKFTHNRQTPKTLEYVKSYFESRVGAYHKDLVIAGYQAKLKQRYVGPVVTRDKIEEAAELAALHFGDPTHFNREGWEHILNKHGGHLPLHIRAVPEGTVLPIDNVILAVKNTDEKVPWLTNWVETDLVQTWYPITVATRSREMKKVLLKYLKETGGDPANIDFKLHCFGYRGVSSIQTAAIGTSAHLINFKGTDTFEGVRYLRKYYGCPMAGFSIPAYEHSTVTVWGKDYEQEAYANALRQYPNGPLAVVSDSYDLINAVKNIWGDKLKEQVKNRNGFLVIRPDSGDPKEVLPEVLRHLWNSFGGTTVNGFALLDPHVRVIQGDGISEDTLEGILQAIAKAGFSTDNLAFGSGGGLLQKMDRDTERFAFKCSSAIVDGVERDVFKQPKTDLTKKSKAGELKLIKDSSGYHTVRVSEPGEDLLVPVYENGRLLVDQNFDDIRARAAL